jgi:hypothetical protein
MARSLAAAGEKEGIEGCAIHRLSGWLKKNVLFEQHSILYERLKQAMM